jgi:hypothetical protein
VTASGRGRPPGPRAAGQPAQTGPERVNHHSPETGLATATPEKDSGFTVQSHRFCRIFEEKAPFFGKNDLFGDI